MNHHCATITTPSPLESVVQQFEHWRATRSKRCKIPDALWSLVAPLMDQYERNVIASALRLNYDQLKHHVSPLITQATNKKMTLVEYPLPLPTSTTERCVVEITCKNGSTVKISELSATQLQPLILALLGG